MKPSTQLGPSGAILLYNDECSICRRIAKWVRKSADASGSVIVQPIGDDPEALLAINPALSIWDAYETIHIVMPDGSMQVGGKAVAEVFRRLPNTKWFAPLFGVRVLGARPFQRILDFGYAILSGIRPMLGCESCGIAGFWVRPFDWIKKWAAERFGPDVRPKSRRRFTAIRSTPLAQQNNV